MDIPDENGLTKRQNLNQVINSAPLNSSTYLSAKLELDSEPNVPYCVEHIWNWFWELNGRRYDYAPLTYTEIKSWIEVKGIYVHRYEIEVIIYLDKYYLNKVIDKKNKKQNKK